MMHRLLCLLSGLTLIFALGCASSGGKSVPPAEPPSESPIIDRVRQSGVLRVGMAGDYPPLNVESRSGEIIGMEPDLAKTLAQALGVRLQVIEKPFSELIPALRAGQVDLAMSGMTMTPRRNLDVAFAGPYFISGKGLLTRTNGLDEDTSAGELDQGGIKLAALRGTTSQVFVEKQLVKAELKLVDSYDEGVELVSSGAVQGLIADYPVCAVWALRSLGLATLRAPLTFEPIGVAMPADDPLFVNLVQNYLKTLEETGLLKSLRSKWFEDASWVNDLP